MTSEDEEEERRRDGGKGGGREGGGGEVRYEELRLRQSVCGDRDSWTRGVLALGVLLNEFSFALSRKERAAAYDDVEIALRRLGGWELAGARYRHTAAALISDLAPVVPQRRMKSMRSLNKRALQASARAAHKRAAALREAGFDAAAMLPPEILEMILSHLSDDRASISACACVNRDWRDAVLRQSRLAPTKLLLRLGDSARHSIDAEMRILFKKRVRNKCYNLFELRPSGDDESDSCSSDSDDDDSDYDS